MKKAIVVAFACAAVGSVSGLAFAATTWLGTSGVTNESKKESHAPAGMGLRQVRLREQSDKPYRLLLWYLDTATEKTGDDQELETNDTSSIGTFDEGSIDLGAGTFATAIQVCTNKKANEDKERIKGIRLWGATINANGTLAQNGTPKDFKHPNCAEWHTKVSCDARSVITDVRAYYGDKGFSGLQIACGVPTPPKK